MRTPSGSATGRGKPMAVDPRRIRWPRGLYEARPFAAIALGLSAAIVALGKALNAGEESIAICLTISAGGMLALYGGMVGQLRSETRRRQRLIAEIKAEARRRDEEYANGTWRMRRLEPPRPTPRWLEILRDPWVRAAIVCMAGGTLLAVVGVARCLWVGDITIWEASEIAIGSVIALYGGLLEQARSRS